MFICAFHSLERQNWKPEIALPGFSVLPCFCQGRTSAAQLPGGSAVVPSQKTIEALLCEKVWAAAEASDSLLAQCNSLVALCAVDIGRLLFMRHLTER